MVDKNDIRALVEKVTGLPGYTSAAGTKVVDVDFGWVVLALEKKSDLLQFNGFFHGGVIAGLADHAAGGAVTTLLAPERIGVTIDLHVNYIAPGDGDRIVAEAKALSKSGGTIHTAQVEVYSETGSERKLCAMGLVTLRAVEVPKM